MSCRLLAQGDVFAVSMADTAKVLVSLLRDTAISTATPNTLVYFRVDKMLPASNSSLLVDPRHSAMTMKVHHLSHCVLAYQRYIQATKATRACCLVYTWGVEYDFHHCLTPFHGIGLHAGVVLLYNTHWIAASATAESTCREHSCGAGRWSCSKGSGMSWSERCGCTCTSSMAARNGRAAACLAAPGPAAGPHEPPGAHSCPTRVLLWPIAVSGVFTACEGLRRYWLIPPPVAYACLMCNTEQRVSLIQFILHNTTDTSAMLLQGAEASSVCVSILIHGPSGCGKSTAVSAAAAALGLNIVPYSCHEFIGQSDAAVAAALKAALESAQEFAPAVLHLEDLSALCSAEQAQGSALGKTPSRCIITSTSAEVWHLFGDM